MSIFSFFSSRASQPRSRLRLGTTTNSDGRLAVRKKQRLVDGYLWSPNMLVARNCSIKDLSAVGAFVELWSSKERQTIREAPLPDRVVLYIVPDQIEVDCEITWRQERSFGLRFLGKFRPGTRQYGNSDAHRT